LKIRVLYGNHFIVTVTAQAVADLTLPRLIGSQSGKDKASKQAQTPQTSQNMLHGHLLLFRIVRVLDELGIAAPDLPGTA
jgi:hypothetical protein